jgi:hypothetical protein
LDRELKETIVIDDLIPLDLQDKFEDLVIKHDWKLVDDMSYAQSKLKYPSYGFNAMFKHPKLGIVSQLYEVVSVPIVNAFIEKTNLSIKDIFFNRAFLQMPLDEKFIKEHNGIHIDIPEPHYACVYYVNNSDGDTILYEQTMYNTEFGSKNVELVEHKRVTPKKGRFVAFDGARYHCSTQPRNGYRCIINFDLTQ